MNKRKYHGRKWWRRHDFLLWVEWHVIARGLDLRAGIVNRGLDPRSGIVNMSWARFDDTTVDDPRMLELVDNLPARVLFYDTRIYCARTLSDGKIRDSVVLGLCRGFEKQAEASVDALVKVGLWRRHPDGDGWLDIDFLKLHKTRVEILAERAKRQKAGALGGHATQANALASALANAEAGANADLGPDEEWLARVVAGDEQ